MAGVDTKIYPILKHNRDFLVSMSESLKSLGTWRDALLQGSDHEETMQGLLPRLDNFLEQSRDQLRQAENEYGLATSHYMEMARFDVEHGVVVPIGKAIRTEAALLKPITIMGEL